MQNDVGNVVKKVDGQSQTWCKTSNFNKRFSYHLLVLNQTHNLALNHKVFVCLFGKKYSVLNQEILGAP